MRRHRGPDSRIAFFGLVAIVSLCRVASGQVCGDFVWERGEYCGHDAYAATGVPDMNHDCVVDFMDAQLFGEIQAAAVYDSSADFNSDGFVDGADWAILTGAWGSAAASCMADPLPPLMEQGTMALSFSADPAVIVNTGFVPMLTPTNVYVVVDGWSGDNIAYGIESSANISVVSHAVDAPAGLALECTPSAHLSWRWSHNTGPAPTPWAIPVIIATLQIVVTTDQAGWIRFAPVRTCYDDPGPRWADSATEEVYRFASFVNMSINGGSPPVTTGVRSGSSSLVPGVRVAPNPFNPAGTVHFELKERTSVTIDVWSVRGARIRTLASKRMFEAGENTVVWDGRDDKGSPVASGVYMFRVRTRNGTRVVRAVLLK